ncbi:type II secretion system protein GspI [Yersinia ruckeri]|nr:type II secretion system minor pseudopilin GspI [Yersinia ruckeri]ARY99992.1 general secretion pathway protein I [Yersinia ruckeri]KFE40453.1 general secretion pathway protein I [Yersinia ruckeri]MCK8565178.1 type II secretion system minor pseudopilin GspI [Yersinia ruckeri]MCK8585710.1 type II secretion system minor pseudopilin GspI [Yersinia ruckeri]MCW6520563.1 type II secretion system minor pseudopilin GspI [Yersinia ruckeri]
MTLLEVMIASAIFSMAALSLLGFLGQNLLSLYSIKDSVFMTLVAENIVNEILIIKPELNSYVDSGTTEMAGQKWNWNLNINYDNGYDIHILEINLRSNEMKGNEYFYSKYYIVR